MSFKRDGDDFHLLNNLKKRRVADLLSTHIPEDEAILMKNGKYACIVCSYRPVFDTLDVLSLHRKGKKHLTHLSRYLQNKEEIRQLKIKRQHELYLKNDETKDKTLLKLGSSLEKLKPSHHTLLLAAPYNSCSKKRPSIGLNRKTRIQLHMEKKSICDISHTGMKSSITDISSSPLILGKDLEAGSGTFRTIPEDKRAKKAVSQYLKSLERKKSFNKIVSHARNAYNYSNKNTKLENPCKQSQSEVKFQNNVSNDASKADVDPDKIKRAEYYLKLRSLGWKPDYCGNWVKDEDAEFDSDDGAPPPMPP